MREKLINYVELLFAGAPEAGDIRQEILQNTLDRYDDLIAQGKSPEAAYSLSISGIGDITELLHQPAAQTQPPVTESEEKDDAERRKNRAAAIFLYILSPIPLFILSEFGQDVIGLCFTLILVAVATHFMVMNSNSNSADAEYNTTREAADPKTESNHEIRRSIRSVIWAVGMAIYFIMSFMTGAWYITWVIFPLIGCVQGLVIACMDLKEAK